MNKPGPGPKPRRRSCGGVIVVGLVVGLVFVGWTAWPARRRIACMAHEVGILLLGDKAAYYSNRKVNCALEDGDDIWYGCGNVEVMFFCEEGAGGGIRRYDRRSKKHFYYGPERDEVSTLSKWERGIVANGEQWEFDREKNVLTPTFRTSHFPPMQGRDVTSMTDESWLATSLRWSLERVRYLKESQARQDRERNKKDSR